MNKKTITKSLFLAGIVAFLISCGGSSGQEKSEIEYVAVQVDNGDNWSIIDKTGKVIVKEEYGPDNEISVVTENGAYWVRQHDKFQLYSVKSPNKALTDDEYDEVTNFSDGLAFAAKTGEPIYLITESGKVKKQLGREVARVLTFNDGMAEFRNQEGLVGFINTSGDVAIKPQYYSVGDFANGYIWVKKESDGNYFIIDKKGKEQFEVKASKYDDIRGLGDGTFLLTPKGDEPRHEIINHKGEVKLKMKKHYDFIASPKDGYIEVHNWSPSEGGIINMDGEQVIRLGKYSDLNNVGNGLFTAKRNDKYGVIDKDDNIIVEFEYDHIGTILLGTNFIAKQGSQWLLIGKDGKEVKNANFATIDGRYYSSVSYVDYDALANNLLADITPTGYAPFKGKTAATDICAQQKLNIDDIGTYTYRLSLPSTKAGNYDMNVTAVFNYYIVVMNYRTEQINDGWSTYERRVEEGLGWNKEARIESVTLETRLTDNVQPEPLLKAMREVMKGKGFDRADDEHEDLFVNKDKKHKWRVGYGTTSGNNFEIYMVYEEEEEPLVEVAE